MPGLRSLGVAAAALVLVTSPALAQTGAPNANPPPAASAPGSGPTMGPGAGQPANEGNHQAAMPPAGESGTAQAGGNAETAPGTPGQVAGQGEAPAAGYPAGPGGQSAAQGTEAGAQPAPMAAAPAGNTGAETAGQNAPPATAGQEQASAPTGTLQKTNGDWRSSKLVGATVYDSQGQDIGTVDDLLLDENGKITNMVISVGGFLGIGAKLVEVPYSQIRFEPSRNSQTASGGTSPVMGASGPTAPRPAGVAAPPGGPSGATGPANGAPANGQAAPPEYSLVLPGATKDTLTKMPSFDYGQNG